MWKVEWGDEQTDTLTLYPIPIQVISDNPGDEVLSRAGPAVKGQCEWFVGLWVIDKTLDGLQNHRLSQVLSVQLCLKVPGQT